MQRQGPMVLCNSMSVCERGRVGRQEGIRHVSISPAEASSALSAQVWNQRSVRDVELFLHYINGLFMLIKQEEEVEAAHLTL